VDKEKATLKPTKMKEYFPNGKDEEETLLKRIPFSNFVT
jgi:hypothetical protein